jgi:fucose 4-O-acetylase-like acetyltransferase
MAIRDAKLDVIKGIAILLVVFGHIIEPQSKSQGLFRQLYALIYAFHVPMFVFAAGVVAKASLSLSDIKIALRRILLPFFVFHIIYASVGYLRFGHLVYDLLTPHWIMWFLLSLFFWRLMLPLFASKAGFIASLVLALGVGWFSEIGYTLSLSRTFYFFPFYLFGHLYGFRLIELKVVSTRVWVFACVASGSMVSFLVWKGMPVNTLYGSFPYPISYEIKAMVLRGLMLVNSALILISVANIIGRSNQLLAYLGRNSLAVYVLHGFLLWPLSGLLAADFALLERLTVSVLATIGMTAVCATCSPGIHLLTGVRPKQSA